MKESLAASHAIMIGTSEMCVNDLLEKALGVIQKWFNAKKCARFFHLLQSLVA
ncbi:MAG: hypothetical protein K2X09_02910 [Rickettsiales bacterium]|nr:hypothetical protein [Rickettsiales bacterium]